MNKESTREVEISFGYPPREGSTKPRASAIKIIGDGWTREQEQQLTSDGREIVRRDYTGGALDSETKHIYDPRNSRLLKTVSTKYRDGNIAYTKEEDFQYWAEDTPPLCGMRIKRLVFSRLERCDDKRRTLAETRYDPQSGGIKNSREFSYPLGSEKCTLFAETQFDIHTGKKVRHYTNRKHEDGHITQITEDYNSNGLLAAKITEEADPNGKRYFRIQKNYHPKKGFVTDITRTNYYLGTGVITFEGVEEFQSDCFLLTRSVARCFDYQTGELITKTEKIFQGKGNAVRKIEERYKSGEKVSREVTYSPQQ